MTHVTPNVELPVGSIGRHANGWWGMIMLIATEAALFGYLLFAYYYLAVQHRPDWLPARLPGFTFSIPNSIILIVTTVLAWRADKTLSEGAGPGVVAIHLLVITLLGAIFIALQVDEWSGQTFMVSTGAFGSLYYTLTAAHVLHVAAGVLMMGALTLWTALGYFDRTRTSYVSIGALYWYFIFVVWLALFFTFYISPRLSVG